MGLPAEEDDLFRKLTEARILSEEMGEKLREMKGFRSILVYEYARVDDKLVYKAVRAKAQDFRAFKGEVLGHLDR